MMLLSSWRALWQQHWRRWLSRRIPSSAEQILSQRNIFIFPTGFGFFYLVITCLLFIIGLNYQNNSVYAFCFFLLAVFVAAMLPTFNNLRGLVVKCKPTSVAIAASQVEVPLSLSSGGRERFQLELLASEPVVVSLDKNTERSISLPMRWSRPGVQRWQNIKLSSAFPLGVYRAWTWLRLDHTVYVAPQPVRYTDLIQLLDTGKGRAAISRRVDADDLALREYREGDGAREVYWRRAATWTDQPLLSKVRGEYDEAFVEEGCLDYTRSRAPSHEAKLADLCFWVLECERRGMAYGLLLPAHNLSLGVGMQHQHRCLQALAEAI